MIAFPFRAQLDAPIAIAKFTHSGSQIIDWTPAGSMAKSRHVYPDFIDFVRSSVAGLEAKGHAVELAAILALEGDAARGAGAYRDCAVCHGDFSNPPVVPLKEMNHAHHVDGTTDCTHCHGVIKEMDEVRKVRPHKMGWCVTCHRGTGAPTDCTTCHK